MRILVLNGSPRPNGNTSRLVESLISCMPEGVEVRTVPLYPKTIAGCRNCGACQRSDLPDHCSIIDDMTPLYREFLEADTVVLASPIYMWQFTTCINAFMSRLHCLFIDGGDRNLMKGKRLAAAMTMGDDEFVAGYAVGAMMDFCEYFGMRYAGAVAVPFASREQVDRPLYREKVADFVARLTSEESS